VENGHIQRTDGDGRHTVVASVGAETDLIFEGARLDAAKTYCRRTVEADSPVALSHAGQQRWADDPAYRTHRLECYLGTTIFVRGDVYGTVCFASRKARETEFGDDEKAFVELVARLLGRELESTKYERELDEHNTAVERAEDKYESLLRAAPDAIFLLDTETGEFVEVNDAATDLTGYDRETLLEMEVPDVHPPDDTTKYRTAFRRFVQDQGVRDRFDDGSPILVRRRDGTDVPVEISAGTVELGDTEYMQSIVRDISDQRERERELRVKSRAIEEASVGITVADATATDVPLVYANREFERTTGYDSSVAVGRNCRFLQGPRPTRRRSRRSRGSTPTRSLTTSGSSATSPRGSDGTG